MAKKLLCVIIIVLAVACIFVSCGGDSENDNANSSIDNPSDNTDISTENNTENGTENPIDKKYAEACELIKNEDYENAYILLNEIKNSSEAAQEKLKNFIYVPRMVEFGNNKITYIYNSEGNVLKATETTVDPYGQEHTYTYDFTYNQLGNVVSGPMLESGSLYNEYTFTYNDAEKLYQIKRGDEVTTYYYNAKGYVSQISKPYSSEYYEYTYHTNGNIKTMIVIEDDQAYECKFNESGKVIKIVFYNDYASLDTFGLWTFEYSNFGMSKACGSFGEGDDVFLSTIEYTYNSNGAVTNVKIIEADEVRTEVVLSNHKLIYSENPYILERANTISYSNIQWIFELYA